MKRNRFFHIAILVLLFGYNLSAQCPLTIQDQGNNNALAVTLTFNDISGNALAVCNCTVAGNSGNLNCPTSCSFVVPGLGYNTISYTDANGNSCLYNNSGSLVSVLPIELLDFTAKPCNNNVCLNWKTATETNNKMFTLEKTKNAVNYDFVATVDGAGNSTTIREYSNVDYAPYEGISYYRLKQTDYDGKFTYSSLIMVDFTHAATLEFGMDVYPNPSTGENISLAVNASKGKEILVVVYDVAGRESYSKVFISEQDSKNVFALDPSGKLAAGIYFVQIQNTAGEIISVKKLIKK